MLGKLLKHEWKVVWKVPTFLIGILMITAVLAGLSFSLPIWDSEWIGLPLSGVMMILMFYFAMIGVGIGITIYFSVRYYKNMFTDEGYLTHTLPVSTHQLLLAKTITISVWNLIAGIAVIVSLMIFGGVTLLSLVPKDSSFAREMVEAFVEIAEELPKLWRNPYMKGINGFGASILCMVLASSFGNSMMMIGSVTLGQMLRKHRILGAVGAYFAMQTVLGFVFTGITMPLMMMRIDVAINKNYMEYPFLMYTPIYFISAVVYTAMGLGLYFLSEYLVRRQLELE